MPALDWIFLAVLLGSLLLGAWRGLVFEVLSVVSWLAAFFLAQWFGPEVGQKLPLGGAGETLRHAAGFALVFIGTVFAGGLIAWIAKKLFASVGLSPADRALGALFGIARGVILLLAATLVLEISPLKTQDWWMESRGAGMAKAALEGIKPVMPENFAKYFP